MLDQSTARRDAPGTNMHDTQTLAETARGSGLLQACLGTTFRSTAVAPYIATFGMSVWVIMKTLSI